MKKTALISAAILLIISLLVIAGPQKAEAKAIELSLSHMSPAGSIYDKQLTAWAKKVERDSGDRLAFRIFPGATLINPFETYDGVEKGVADLGASYRYSRAGAELTGITSMLLAGLPDAATGSRIMAEVWKKFPEFAQEWRSVKVIYTNASGPAVVATTTAVRKMADFKGLSLRVPVPEAADALKELGGASVNISTADMVIGMRKGTVQGGLVFKEAIESFKLPVTHVTEFGMYESCNWFLVMNWKSWNKLPPDLQKIIDDNAEWGRNESIKAFDAADASAVKYATAQGVEFIKLDPAEEAAWFAKVDASNRKHAAALDAKGYPATKVLEFINSIK
jgi:TRAP-type transport system periplasmic protein